MSKQPEDLTIAGWQKQSPPQPEWPTEMLAGAKRTLPANPKDRHGINKVSLSKFPAAALAHGAHAFMDGAEKYGAYNWREKAVIASIYVDAAKRHVDAWFDAREQCAPDSDVHHLGHALACIAIILDAEATGNLIDDRPVKGTLTATYNKIAATIERRAGGKR